MVIFTKEIILFSFSIQLIFFVKSFFKLCIKFNIRMFGKYSFLTCVSSHAIIICHKKLISLLLSLKLNIYYFLQMSK